MRVLTSGNKMGYKCIDFPMMGQYFFNLWNKDRVGRHENLFILFLMANKKLQGRHKNIGSVGLAETQVFFFFFFFFGLNSKKC